MPNGQLAAVSRRGRPPGGPLPRDLPTTPSHQAVNPTRAAARLALTAAENITDSLVCGAAALIKSTSP
jgi:hypothetical protein